MRQNATEYLRDWRRMAWHFCVSVSLLTMVGCSSVDQAEDRAPLPALNNPAVTSSFPGKPVWIDLYTNDAAAAETFYAEIFGWTLHTINSEYLEFRSGEQAVAGLFLLPADGSPHYSGHDSGWNVSLSRALPAEPTSLGASAISDINEMPDRGRALSLKLPGGAAVTMLASSSGDPAGLELPANLTWSGLELVTADHDRAATFLTRVFGYTRQDWTLDNGITITVMSRVDGEPALTIRGPLPDTTGSRFVPMISVQGRATADGDHQAFVARVQAAGGAVLRPTEAEAPGWQTTIFVDPQGNIFGIEG